MNTFTNGSYEIEEKGFNYRKTIDSNNQDTWVTFDPANPPFFIQCGGAIDKHQCLADVLAFFKLFTKDDLTKIVQTKFPRLGKWEILKKLGL